MSDRMALELKEVVAGYRETKVLEELTLALVAGESISIIGRNGVGKTTLLATIMGHTNLHAGSIRLEGRNISNTASFQRVKQGLGYVPQEREIFPSLTVNENLTVGASGNDWKIDDIFELFPNLAERRTNMGNQISGGEQQMLAIGRALMTSPRILLMDEPSEGLAPVIVEELVKVMTRLRDEGGMAIILVEQNTHIALNFSERTIDLDRGKITFDGDSQALSKDNEMLENLIGISEGNHN